MPDDYAPVKPFPSYKWYWASKQPTEALNDPAVLFGVLRIIAFLSGRGIRYNSAQFSEQLIRLNDDVSSTVSLSKRVGERNLIRNSGQYWSALGLIPADRRGGIITITDFGADVATSVIDQGDFAALTIASFALPNKATYSADEIDEWQAAGLMLYPFRLLLGIMQELQKFGSGWLTPREAARVVVPMAGERRDVRDIADRVLRFRERPELFADWPDCTPESNDMRFVREYFLFLSNYGFADVREDFGKGADRFDERYCYLPELEDVVTRLVEGDASPLAGYNAGTIDAIRMGGVSSTVVSTVARRRAQRPGQAQFRQSLLREIGKCPVTNVDLPEVLEAAHIKPHAPRRTLRQNRVHRRGHAEELPRPRRQGHPDSGGHQHGICPVALR